MCHVSVGHESGLREYAADAATNIRHVLDQSKPFFERSGLLDLEEALEQAIYKPGPEIYRPGPWIFHPAGFGGLRARNPAGRTDPGAGAIGFRLGTIDRSSGAESHQSGTVESFCNSPTDGLKSKGSVLRSRSVYIFGRISGDPREGELS